MRCDFLIIGAGMSGAAAAYELSAHGTVVVLEGEAMPGYHSTGRSAALYTRNYGNRVVRLINQASHAFLVAPPAGFASGPLLSRRGALSVASAENRHGLDAILALSTPGHEIEPVDAARCLELVPFLRHERVAAGAYEAGVMDMDVAMIHQGFLRGAKARGAAVLCSHRVTRCARKDGGWQVTAGDLRITARIVVNAAGAWAGQLAALAGARAIDLEARKRTAITIDAPAGHDLGLMPALDVVGHDAYLKPDAGRLMASPGDQTPVEPQDAQPDEWDIAVLAEWIETETQLNVRRIASRWAGLRVFAPDESPVVGFDPDVPDFVWLAGQGGYGIMMAPALARAAATLVMQGNLPADMVEAGLNPGDLSPARFG